MAKTIVFKNAPKASEKSPVPPQKDHHDYYLAKRLAEISGHLQDLSATLFDIQDEDRCGEARQLVTGVSLLIEHHANDLGNRAQILNGGEMPETA